LAIGLFWTSFATAEDWSQYLGPNRDGNISEFKEPDTWPKELKKPWNVVVGEGVSAPALVGGKLFVFAKENGLETTYCLDAESGAEIWRDAYPSASIEGGASRHSGPRSTPAVSNGKVVTLGLHGVLSCLDASTGKLLWRKEDFEGKMPQFYTGSSPLIVEGLCIAQVSGIYAYDLTSGEEKWRWTDDGPSYGSPILIKLEGTQAIIAPTEKNLAVLRVSDGELLWQRAYIQGRNNTASPIVKGQSLFIAGPGRGMTASKFIKTADGFDTEELWQNPENSLQFNSPILSNGFVYGISQRNELFSINAETGKTAWVTQVGPPPGANQGQQPGPGGNPNRGDRPQGQQVGPGGERTRGENAGQGQQGGQGGRLNREGGGQGQAGGQGGERRRRGRGGQGGGGGGGGSPAGFGSIVGTDSVLFALTPTSELIVLQAGEEKSTELARYKVSDSPTYAYPVLAGNRIFIKDQNSVTLYTTN
jgi:outer membrane protein assembly factor BamB